MFGMLRPCSHGAAKYGIDPAQWRAHMCGLCLGLRDGQGQLARTATNTDAIVLSVLTEAQSSGPVRRTTAGRCALRGMQRAEVAATDAPGVLLASTASLLLGSAKIRDHVEDRDGSVLTRRPMAKVSTRWADGARAQAGRIGLDVEPLVAAINSQSELERNASALSLDDLTVPTQTCAAEFFAHTAVLAGAPGNIDPMREAGRHFGRIAHLADAIEDFDADSAHGRFNPLAATGTALPEAYDLLRQSDSDLRRAVAAARLADAPTVRWILLDPLTALLRRLSTGVGATIAHTCASADRPHAERRGTRRRDRPHAPFRPPHRRPGLGESLALVLGSYCTGYALCADHRNPCTGEQKPAWWKEHCGSCCDCAEGCSSCGECCSCGGCCDGCGCDC
ncbi:DUF5685 family protein [Nocardia goodfellowii]|uniref:Regulatory protein n=1 Tax=Nocardia goodfellowii TaxID=882446 RepID=A0ABS4Q9T6_9NOCA|nr:DUF5685 family protein [Nocardia goodfellowii]MBP2188455.1 hypothetical protein [Nocardia goodfellowii]